MKLLIACVIEKGEWKSWERWVMERSKPTIPTILTTVNLILTFSFPTFPTNPTSYFVKRHFHIYSLSHFFLRCTYAKKTEGEKMIKIEIGP